MTYRVDVMPAAARQIRKLDAQSKRRIEGVLALLADEPRPPSATRLVGSTGEWRVRTGDYRMVYEIHDKVLVVLVIAIGHRRDIYRAR